VFAYLSLSIPDVKLNLKRKEKEKRESLSSNLSEKRK
jgi:hypothetical protein